MVVGRELWRHVMKSIFVIFGCGYTLMGGAGATSRRPKVFAGQMDNMTVSVGDTARFRCEVLVSEATGWKHRTDLVFLRNQLYTVDANYNSSFRQNVGVHELAITNVSGDDHGAVECIAKWGRGDLDWAGLTAYLNVLVPPSDIKITTNYSRSDGNIVTTRMDEVVTLLCVAYNGRPSPKLVWYQRARRLNDGVDGNASAFKEWTDEAASYGSLTFKARSADDGADFTCQAESPALEKPLAASIKLNVRYPPKTPVIRGTGDYTKARVGDANFRLVCVDRGGNPPPQLTWFRNNLQDEGALTTHSRDTTSVLAFTPQIRDNNAVLKCEAVNDLMPRGISVHTVLVVIHGPTTVTLNAPSEAQEGDQLEMNCTSGPSNPPAEITWTINNRPYSDRSVHYEPTSEGAYKTTSKVMADFPPHEVNDISVKCQAVNPETKEASHSSGTVRVTPKISAGRPVSSRRSGFNRDTDKAHVLRNETGLDASPNKKLSDSLTVIIVTSVAVGGTVVIVLLGCMLYVWKRGRAKRFQGMANSDTYGSSKGQADIYSQSGMEVLTDTTALDFEQSPVDSFGSPKKQMTPTTVRGNAASTHHLMDQAYQSPYGTYRHWVAPEPGSIDADSIGGTDYEGEDFYVESLRRSARETVQPRYIHSPSPLRPVPPYFGYEPLSKSPLISAFHGAISPTHKSQSPIDDAHRGHLV